MRDDEFEEFEIPPDDPAGFLEELDSDLEDLEPDDLPSSGTPLSRREIDEAVDRILDEELARLNGHSRKKKP